MAGTGFYAIFQNCTIGELIYPYLGSFIQFSTGTVTNHIVDKTGLTGTYDYSLKFDTHAPESAAVVSPFKDAASSRSSESEPSGLPSLFRAMERQLGLRLVRVAKGVELDTIVIDRIAKAPTED